MFKNTTGSVKNSSAHLIAGIFCLLIILNKFFFHEMWKDEWQAWQLATKTGSLSELFSRLPGEGHPSLWFILLRLWDLVAGGIFPSSAEWFRLQLVHSFLVLLVIYLLIFKVEASGWKKILFITSYFILYEYSVVARPYILLVLLSLLMVIQLQKDEGSIVVKSVLIFFLTQTEVYGVFISAGFLVASAFKEKEIQVNKQLLICTVILLTGAVLFYLQVNPANATQLYESSELQRSFYRTVTDPLHSLTLNTFIPGFADTVFREEPGFISLFLAALLLTGILSLFKNERRLLVAFLTVFLLFYVFGVFFFLGGVRNWGILYVFALCLILLRKKAPQDWKEYSVLALFFLFQFIHGANVMLSDLTGKFSNARDAAEFITTEIPEEVPVIGLNKPYCVPLAGYAERPLIGMPEKTPYFFFEERDWRGKAYLPDMEELLMMKEHLRSKKLVVVYNKPLNRELYPLLKPVVKFDEPSLRKESYFFYYF